MSSILKALKKLEDDKATHRPEELKIDTEILRVDSFQRFSSAGVIAISLLLLASGSCATYLFMKKDKGPVAAVSTASAPVLRPPLAADAVPELRPEKLPDAMVVVPAQPPQKNVRIDNVKLNQPQKSGKKVSAAVDSQPVRPLSSSIPANSAKVPASSPPPAKTVPKIRINGIAFQGNSADSLAIVNGAPISSGAMVEGVRVEEIQRDRVRFSHNGESFEVLLGQSNR